MRRILIVAGACAMGEMLTDYGDPVDMRPADLVGTWVSGKARAIVFDEDATFALRQEGVVYLVFFYVGSGGNSWCAYHK